MPNFTLSVRTTAPNAAAASGSNDVARLTAALWGLGVGWMGEGTRRECQLCYVVGHGIYASHRHFDDPPPTFEGDADA